MTAIRVGIVGAAGQTGGSIVNGLFDQGGFEITALVRPTSMDKPGNKALQARGVTLRSLDLNASIDEIAIGLKDIDILISAVGPTDQLEQFSLADAAKQAGVKRFLPCGAMPIVPPGGLHLLRDQKEQVYNHIKMIGLPYTIVDVGWWYQLHFPNLPSGRVDYAVFVADNAIAGDGTRLSALTDLRDIGRYIARIIVDDRTLNKYVLVYNEMWSQNQVYDLMARLSGEDIPRKYESRELLEQWIREGKGALEADPEDVMKLFKVVHSQYKISWGIRGDNTPEYGKYLGYLDGKELYPDIEGIKFEDYLRELLDGKATSVYDDLKPVVAKLHHDS